MTDRWRFVSDGDRRELFDMQADPGQKTNVAQMHPDVFRRLSGDYEKWYASISTRFEDYVRITLGDDAENPAHLSCHDWHTGDAPLPWNHPSVARHPKNNGFWAVDIKQAGDYEITLRLRPHYVKEEVPLEATSARIKISDTGVSQTIPRGAASVTFIVPLEKGPSKLETWLEGEPRGSPGAYFVNVKRL
jgi:hypothetical protein